MTSDYNKSRNAQPFDEWLKQVIEELYEVGYTTALTVDEHEWLEHTWDNYDLSPAEAAQSFINEMPA